MASSPPVVSEVPVVMSVVEPVSGSVVLESVLVPVSVPALVLVVVFVLVLVLVLVEVSPVEPVSSSLLSGAPSSPHPAARASVVAQARLSLHEVNRPMRRIGSKVRAGSGSGASASVLPDDCS
jgi:hypothetical protein